MTTWSTLTLLARSRRNVVVGVAGLTADASSMVNLMRLTAQRHLSVYDEDMPVEQLCKRLCDVKQGYTQYGGASSYLYPLLLSLFSPRKLCISKTIGLRPFGVSILYAGWDPHYQFQLYHSDPSGNYSGWKATCIGSNSGTAQNMLKQHYKDDITLDAAMKLVLETMGKTMDSTTLGSDKRTFHLFYSHQSRMRLDSWFLLYDVAVEFATITLDKKTKIPFAKIFRPAEVDALLKKHGLAKSDDEEMKS